VPAEEDIKLYAPVIKHTYPLNSGALTKCSALQIQNVGSGPADFTITYKVAASQADPTRAGLEFVDTTTCQDIEVGQTCFAMTLLPVAGSGTAQLRAGEYAAATVESTENMVAVVNEETLFTYSPGSEKQFATYSAVPDNAKSANVSIPAYKEEWVGRYMGVTVMNVGTANATIDATVLNVNLATPPTNLVARYTNLAPGSAATFWLLSRNQAQTLGGVTIVSGSATQFQKTNNSMSLSSTQPVAVIVNQENSYLSPPAVRLDAANYEGFPLP
jgi:hypothetical protein